MTDILSFGRSCFSTGSTNSQLLDEGPTNNPIEQSLTDSEKSEATWGRGRMLQPEIAHHVTSEPQFDEHKTSETLNSLIDLISDLLPVDERVYPELAKRSPDQAVTFCLRHSALHFSKTAGKLAAFVEGADHGKYDRIQVLQAIVAASLVNSLKLADEIGFTGDEIVNQIKLKFYSRDQLELQT